MIRKRIAGVAVSGLTMGLLFVGATSCGKVADKASEKAAEKIAGDALGGDVDYDPDTGKVKIKNDDGSFTYGDEMPSDWPDDIPLPDGLKIEGAITSDTPEGKSHTLTGSTDKSVDEVAEFYEKNMSGWTKEGGSTFESDGKLVTFQFKDGNREVSISIIRNEGETSTDVLFTYMENKSS